MRILLILGALVWAAAPAVHQPHPSTAKIEVAGEFYQGDMAGVEDRLTLRSNHTFRYRWREFGNIVDHGHGKVAGRWRLDGSRLVLVERASENTLGFPLEYQVVPWGPRLYLVAENRMLEFCNRVNGGFEPRFLPLGGNDFLRAKDWEKAAPGRPEVDPAWMDFLLSRTVKARVTAVDHATVYLAAVHFEELKPGMSLYTIGKPPLRVLRVLKVSPSLVASSEVGPVEVGEWVTSRALDPDRRFHP